MTTYRIAIHGGGVWRDAMRGTDADYIASLETVLDHGQTLAEKGLPAIDIAQALTLLLEDDPLYKAGRGSVAQRGQVVTMDAALMDGYGGRYGAATTLRNVKNPILLARHIMDNRTEKMVVGPGAEDIARDAGLVFEKDDYFCVEPHAGPGGTVGAVVRDASGNIASATSTGGFPGHKVSAWRVGDSPIIAAGTFADNRSCAISACGHGEALISAGVTRRIAGRIEFLSMTAQQAADATFAELQQDMPDAVGGIICVDTRGTIGLKTTPTFIMACGTMGPDGLKARLLTNAE